VDKWDILNILRCNGVIATPQRLKLLSFFLKEYGCSDLNFVDYEDKDMYMARRVQGELMSEGYFISLSTIYKNMELFKKLGLFGDDVI